MTEQRDELLSGLRGEIDVRFEFRILAGDAVDAACRRVDLILVMLPVSDVELIHVGDVERAIGRVRNIDRPERGIAALHHHAVIFGVE